MLKIVMGILFASFEIGLGVKFNLKIIRFKIHRFDKNYYKEKALKLIG
jgi:hypothetical protein